MRKYVLIFFVLIFILLSILAKCYKGDSKQETNADRILIVLQPTGGEVWKKGTYQTIKWQDSVASFKCWHSVNIPCVSTLQYDIKLVPYYTPCTKDLCLAYERVQSFVIAKSVYGSFYEWPVGENLEAHRAIQDGLYNIQICETKSSVCNVSNSYFTISE